MIYQAGERSADTTKVSQPIVAAAVSRPKDFIVEADYFLILATSLEISLHALRFAPGSDRLLAPMRTQYAVASDDVLTTALTSDVSSGRIFLGGNDGCIHELQYSQDESSWLRRPRKCRKVAISWNLQSQLPAALQRICTAVFGQSEAVVQLATEASRGYLIALSSLSNISVFHVPQSQRNAQGRLEERPVIQLCSISQSAIASEVGRIKARLFPGLLAMGSRGLTTFGAVAAATGLASAPPKLIKVWPVEKTQGGSIVACVIAEDGTRIFLRGVCRSTSSSMPSTISTDGSAQGNQVQPRGSQITSLAVHHVRFLDALAPRNLRVKDALWEDGVTLLHCQMSDANPSLQAGRGAGGSEAVDAVEVVIALSTDLRVVAQKQGRNRSPLLQCANMAEHVDTIHLNRSGSTLPEIFGLATLPRPVSKPVDALFGRPGNGLVLPVVHLSELAKQQLVPAPSFIIVSSIGAHILRKMQPINMLRDFLLNGSVMQLQEFVSQYTAEQVCAMCFQILTQAIPKLARTSRTDMADASTASRNKLRGMAKNNLFTEPKLLTTTTNQRDPAEEVLLLRTEQFLLSPQLSVQMGFSQVLPSLEGRSHPQALVQNTPLGYSVMFHSTARLSARLRGLYSYLSRLIRPFWLSPIMLVTWPPAPAEKAKRKRDEWWPPPPDPPPIAKGAQWKCAFSKCQRSYVQSELSLLKTCLDRCLPRLLRAEPSLTDMGIMPNSQEEQDAAHGAAQIVIASLEALDFLDLLSGCTTAMSSGCCSAEVLQRFSELTFRDLVCQPEARQVLQQLMQAGIVACRDLSRCPTLFSQADLEIQESFEVLGMVHTSLKAAGATSMLEIARLSGMTHRALSVLERHASHVNLAEAANRLRAVGACKAPWFQQLRHACHAELQGFIWRGSLNSLCSDTSSSL